MRRECGLFAGCPKKFRDVPWEWDPALQLDSDHIYDVLSVVTFDPCVVV